MRLISLSLLFDFNACCTVTATMLTLISLLLTYTATTNIKILILNASIQWVTKGIDNTLNRTLQENTLVKLNTFIQ